MMGKSGSTAATKLGSVTSSSAAAAAPSSWSSWQSVVRFVTNFRLKTKQQELLLRVSALVLIYVLAFATRLFSVLRYESVIHEFDPYFNYRTALYLTRKGFYEFWNWFDYETSYRWAASSEIRFVGFQHVQSGEHMAAMGVFFLMQIKRSKGKP